ncbi:MAG: isoprenylcysteine carboxylmethyltransferase family protein [Desulfobacterales bacterium]|nr:isoprenylcysteine carboxylmethyltransferase family protein [Desulfobacterales bacterium]
MTKDFGQKKFIHDIKHRRHRFRQLLGIVLAILFSVAGQPIMSWFVIGVILVFIGIFIRLWASGHIKKDKVLATDGPYAFVRHPLYVGNILLTLGFALASGLWWSFPLMIVFLIGFYPPAIRKEDEKLHNLFKEDWEKWRQDTKALIPRLTLLKKGQRGDWSFWQSLRQNGEPVIALFLLLCLYYLFLKLI